MPGVTLYQGPSMIDGAPIVCVLLFGSRNRKTGDMDQTYILRSDLHPYAAMAQRKDVSICGACPWRPQWTDGDTFTGRACYVDLRIIGAIWKGWRAGKYPRPASASTVGTGRKIRLGTYGDPAAVPLTVWESLLSRASMHTGYTHQWKAARFSEFKRWCMASCDTVEEQRRARERGWGTFTITREGVALGTVCPASREAGHRRTCEQCGQCDGRPTDIVIAPHGFGAKFVQLRRARPPLWRPHYGQLSLGL